MPSESTTNYPPKTTATLKCVAVDTAVMRGREHLCTAPSRNMAMRISRALNAYHRGPDAQPHTMVFAAMGALVQRGEEKICTARSPLIAHWIAHALNLHKPDERGR